MASHETIKTNMFPAAWGAIPDWTKFHWHTYADSPRSSQVMAIDVFGTLITRSSFDRDAIMGAVAAEIGVPTEGPWEIYLEWSDPLNGLAELTTTKVDAVAIGSGAIILFECKFTEGGGTCSQIVPDRKGHTACSGAYKATSERQQRCSLSSKGIRYWDHIAELFGIEAGQDHEPCPFALDTYQWMRNVVLARSLASTTGKKARVVAAYAEAPFLQTAAKAKTGLLGLPTVRQRDAIVPLSYQGLIEIAAKNAPSDVWGELAAWLDRKIERERR